ncbi:MAG: uncharacterized protein A8A55_3674, partial [Amphiamblys sp. WSBS2006]
MVLRKHAVEILPKLRLHCDNETEVLDLNADQAEQVADFLGMEDNSIWVGKVEKLLLKKHAVQILPKLGLHGGNEMEVLDLYVDSSEYITEILKTENRSIWLGKVK